MRTLKLAMLLATVSMFGAMLQGCSVNVIVAPHAQLSVSSDDSTNPYQYLEAAPLYDCVAGPDADVCQ